MFDITIEHEGVITTPGPDGNMVTWYKVEGEEFDATAGLPLFVKEITLPDNNSVYQLKIEEPQYEACPPDDSVFLENTGFRNETVSAHFENYRGRGVAHPVIKIIPIRYNPANGRFYRLTQCQAVLTPAGTREQHSAADYTEHSVLSQGEWFQFRIDTSGIYRLSYNDLVSAGMDVSGINPKNIRLFGNPGSMLPEANSAPKPDDLVEIPILVMGEEDNSFDPQDYIIFYCEDPHEVDNELGFLKFSNNLYDDYSYYYLTAGSEEGLRISSVPSSGEIPSHYIAKFNEYLYYAPDNINLIESGKVWYSDEFGIVLTREYHFPIPDRIDGSKASVKIELANRTFHAENLNIRINDDIDYDLPLTPVSVQSTKYAQFKKKSFSVEDTNPYIHVTLTHEPTDAASRMWLDFIQVNAISKLKLRNGQIKFREISSVNDGAVTQFTVFDATPETVVWDVTHPASPFAIESEYQDNTIQFTVETSNLREFIAFDGSSYFTPEFTATVENQDLHGTEPAEYVVITWPGFMEQANQLAQFHSHLQGFSSIVVTPQQIYHEFSGGRQDPTAIRNFLKMYWDRSEGTRPRYVLLFGDGSFDPKDRIPHNTNFIPTFQLKESWITASSFVVEDYYGLLDDDEGTDATGMLDIGIGRLPVTTVEEAQTLVDKIIGYMSPGFDHFGSWRSDICMIADDEDGNLHLIQADSLAENDNYIPERYNLSKVYLDAFEQISTPSGDRYPEVMDRIDEQVNNGALLINYIGHGGTGGWAHERILVDNDILSWENSYRLPVFITATCEFSRFDEPEIASAGEKVLLHSNGGGIALFTTTRLAYAQSNFRLNERLFARMFVPVNGEMPFLGDLIRESKPPGQGSTRNFVLLGDPAVRMAYPEYNVTVTSVNGQSTGLIESDTLKALQKVTIEGEITGSEGERISGFDGYIRTTFFDKRRTYSTLANDPQYSYPTTFRSRDRIVWSGTSTVKEGSFSITFVIPLDIDLGFGHGKFSFYAWSEDSDALTGVTDFILGGIDPEPAGDEAGPEISLFINDTTFVSGQLSNPDPVLLVYLRDNSGINSTSNGIGHNIYATLTGPYSEQVVLDRYFVQDIDSYQSGSISYPWYQLPDGDYTVTVKAWDVYNNSSEALIKFSVDNDANLQIIKLYAYPNPTPDVTHFTFEHTRPGTELSIDLTIYNFTGELVNDFSLTRYSPGTHLEFLTWNGRDNRGNRVPAGIYIYSVTIRDDLGREAVRRQKLIIR
ncbi:MAG: type IX secretion system sortase PorU [Bacteroidales bacterium]